jgi:hypothetical protein
VLCFASLTFLTSSVVLGCKLYEFHRRGIVEVLGSFARGRGSTKSIMDTVGWDFAFLGIGARKWLDETSTFRAMCRRAGSMRPAGSVRLLTLSPDSPCVSEIAQGADKEADTVRTELTATVQQVLALRQEGVNIELRLYDEMPLFRLAFADDRVVYLGFYRPDSRGIDSPQIVLRDTGTRSFYRPLRVQFEALWLRASEPEWQRYAS